MTDTKQNIQLKLIKWDDDFWKFRYSVSLSACYSIYSCRKQIEMKWTLPIRQKLLHEKLISSVQGWEVNENVKRKPFICVFGERLAKWNQQPGIVCVVLVRLTKIKATKF